MDGRTVGIVGGGQLGRMTAEAGLRLGVKVAILDPLGTKSPAGEVASVSVEGSGMLADADEAKVRALAAACDIVTIEIEHVDTKVLSALEASGVCVRPSSATIAVIQDKYRQKVAFAKAEVPMPDFLEAPSLDSLTTIAATFGYPFMLKSRTGAYDGNGNFVVRDAASASEGFAKLRGETHGLYAEKWVPFAKELAVMVVRSETELIMYPVVETTQHNSICHTVVAPARVSHATAALARSVASRAIASLPGAIGIFGVELFLLDNGQVMLNEVAPRPHNSGHYTMEACAVDQFENHLRAVLGLPLGSGEMVCKHAIMVNVLGEDSMEGTLAPLKKAMKDGNGGIHWYGKASSRSGRKMAHVTFCGSSAAAVQRSAEAMKVAVFSPVAPVVGIIMGSDSDLPTMKDAADVLIEFGVPFEITIVSAHRTPERMYQYAQDAAGRGLSAIIAGAGGAAHLPGMVAALTPLPVIGVPVKSSTMSGLDSLYSIVQMPKGVPVATVAIGNAANAGLLAVRMLAIGDAALMAKLVEYNTAQTTTVMGKAERMETALGNVSTSQELNDKYQEFVAGGK